jgi:hypothetical protein
MAASGASDNLIPFVALGIGGLLLYCAITNRSPLSIAKSVANGTANVGKSKTKSKSTSTTAYVTPSKTGGTAPT